MNPQTIFLASEMAQPPCQDALFHIVPVPYEKTVSYGGGTKNGPSAIISASNQLETWDGFSEPCMQGIYTHQAIDCDAHAEEVMARIRQQNRQIAQMGGIPFVLGGEHTVSYGAVMGVVDAYPNEAIGIVHFDAHADLRDEYEGSPWSHASVIKRLVDENLPIFQLGIRAISKEEQILRNKNGQQIQYLDAQTLCRPTIQHQFRLPENFPDKIYLTVDIDGLDGTVMPATGTPVPGGLGYWQLLDLFACACQEREVLGMDLVEFAPIEGFHVYDYTAAELAYKMMGIVERARQKR